MPIPKIFPSDADLNRVAKEEDLYRIYKCDVFDHEGKTKRGVFRLKEFFANDKDKSEILAIALNVAPVIIDTGTDFLFGEPVKIAVDDKVEGDQSAAQKKIDEFVERNSLMTKLEESSLLLQDVGHAHFKLYKKDGKAYIEEVPFRHYFPNWDGVGYGQETNNPRIAFPICYSEDGVKTKEYYYVEDYFMDGKKAVIEYSLWEYRGGRIGQQVELSAAGITREGTVQGLYVRQDTDLDELPFVSIDLRKTALERLGASILLPVLPLLEELNDRITQVSLQMLKHLDPLLQIPETSATRDTKTGKIKRVDLEVLLAKAGEPDARYVTNDNPMIEENFKHMESIVRKIAKLTQTPDVFLEGDEKGGVESAESLRVRLMSLLKRVRRYQRKYDEAIKKIMRIRDKIEGGKGEVPIVNTFDAGLPKDWKHDVEVWGDAVTAGIASQETAVARFQAIEGEELEAEMERIKEDAEREPQFQMGQNGNAPIPEEV